MDQTVKNPPVIQEIWVQSLGQEYPLEKGMATHTSILCDFPGGASGKEPACQFRRHEFDPWVGGWELGRSLEEEMATHFNILAWGIPWTEEPSRLQSIRLQRIGHD